MKSKIRRTKSPFPVYLVGPTGVGKTAVSIELAGPLNAEIVVADSMQVYRGLDRGTAKPNPEEQKKVVHHLLDSVEITQEFNVAQFVQSAQKAIESIQIRSKTPLVVGGTGLYIRSLIDGIFKGPGRDGPIRQQLEKEADQQGWASLYDRLKKVDLAAALKIEPQNHRRLIRALEVYELTGKPISSFQGQWGLTRISHHISTQSANSASSASSDSVGPAQRTVEYASQGLGRPPCIQSGLDGLATKSDEKSGLGQREACLIGLDRNRDELRSRIDERVEGMFKAGLVSEVKALLSKEIENHPVVMQAIGYKEVISFLKGQTTLEEAKQQVKFHSRQFAKRQRTWFRKDSRIQWFLFEKGESSLEMAKRILMWL
ncbi:MAG: tRNA (adenosine(37)-N6)-dimethylallyltransferase MiaA [Chlamydiae bacterium]|nr:tRNA (adenosine(37)-N6)-dimethylallyltransferase MiaA [Chlamydiota bacterium]MBI3276619.1 tRNA (adenosine(37)-N6)-dimethylallyltransferase MiaA [Chlamydiota bacterium]